MDIDNIAMEPLPNVPKLDLPITVPTTVHDVPPPSPRKDLPAADSDDYAKKFDVIADRNTVLGSIAAKILDQPYDQLRLREVVNYVSEQQKLNADVYALLVEMNNYFADNH